MWKTPRCQLVRAPKHSMCLTHRNPVRRHLSVKAAMLTAASHAGRSASLAPAAGSFFEPVHGSAPDNRRLDRGQPPGQALSAANVAGRRRPEAKAKPRPCWSGLSTPCWPLAIARRLAGSGEAAVGCSAAWVSWCWRPSTGDSAKLRSPLCLALADVQGPPIVAVTGFSGAGTSTVQTRLRAQSFRSRGCVAGRVEGDSLSPLSAGSDEGEMAKAQRSGREFLHSSTEPTVFDKLEEFVRT